LDKSFAAYMMAIEIDPSHLGAHEYLGELYLMRDQKDKALKMLEKLNQLAGSNTEEYRELKIAIDKYQS
jgi:tetratricopeptide (TPR) repeat protein